MSRLLPALLILALACAGGGPQGPSPEIAPPTPGAPAPAGAEAVIRGVYAPYLAGADVSSPLDTPGLLTPGLAALVAAERAKMEVDGLGALDFDVAVDAQDFRVTDLGCTTTGDESNAVVVATFRNLDEPTTVTWVLVHDGAGWKVDDVRFAGGRTLRRILGG